MDLHLEMTEAASPANRAVQSKNMWKESEISPKLEAQVNSTIISTIEVSQVNSTIISTINNTTLGVVVGPIVSS